MNFYGHILMYLRLFYDGLCLSITIYIFYILAHTDVSSTCYNLSKKQQNVFEILRNLKLIIFLKSHYSELWCRYCYHSTT